MRLFSKRSHSQTSRGQSNQRNVMRRRPAQPPSPVFVFPCFLPSIKGCTFIFCSWVELRPQRLHFLVCWFPLCSSSRWIYVHTCLPISVFCILHEVPYVPTRLLNISWQYGAGPLTIVHTYNVRIYLNSGMVDLWLLLKDYTIVII